MGIMDHIPDIFNTEFGAEFKKFEQNTELNNIASDAANGYLPFLDQSSPFKKLLNEGLTPRQANEEAGQQAANELYAQAKTEHELQFNKVEFRRKVAASQIVQRFPEIVIEDLRSKENVNILKTFARHYDLSWQGVFNELKLYQADKKQGNDLTQVFRDERVNGDDVGDPYGEMIPPGSGGVPDITIPFHKDESGAVTLDHPYAKPYATSAYTTYKTPGDAIAAAKKNYQDPTKLTVQPSGAIGLSVTRHLSGGFKDPLTGHSYEGIFAAGRAENPLTNQMSESNVIGWQEGYNAIGETLFGPAFSNPRFQAQYKQSFSAILGMYALMELANDDIPMDEKRPFLRWFDEEMHKNPNILKGVHGQDPSIAKALIDIFNNMSDPENAYITRLVSSTEGQQDGQSILGGRVKDSINWQGRKLEKDILDGKIDEASALGADFTFDSQDAAWDQLDLLKYLMIDDDWSRSIVQAMIAVPNSDVHNNLNLASENAYYGNYVNHKLRYDPEKTETYLSFLKKRKDVSIGKPYAEATKQTGAIIPLDITKSNVDKAKKAADTNTSSAEDSVTGSGNLKETKDLFPFSPTGYGDPTSRFYKKQVSDVYDAFEGTKPTYDPRSLVPSQEPWAGIGEPATNVDEKTQAVMAGKVAESDRRRKEYLESVGMTESDAYRSVQEDYQAGLQRERQNVERLYTQETLDYYDDHKKLPDWAVRKKGIGDQSVKDWLAESGLLNNNNPDALHRISIITRGGKDKLERITAQQAHERLQAAGWAAGSSI